MNRGSPFQHSMEVQHLRELQLLICQSQAFAALTSPSALNAGTSLDLVLVVKQNSSLPDKAPTAASPSLEQTPKDPSSINTSWHLNSLRQLSSRYLDSLHARKHTGQKGYRAYKQVEDYEIKRTHGRKCGS